MKYKCLSLVIAAMSLLFLTSTTAASASSESGKEVKLRAEFYQNELDLLLDKARRGNFADFYEDVLKFARYGEKYPQYLLGVMLLKGDGVQQDVAQGIVWMRLSLEQKNTEWQRAYDKVVDAIPAEQLASIEPMFELYKARYGVDTQYMSCRNEKMESSSIRLHQCRKSLVMKEYYLYKSFE